MGPPVAGAHGGESGAEVALHFQLADLFEAAADAWPDRDALVADPARLTFRALDERATRFGNHLAAHGIGRGDRVGILAHNRAEWVEAMLGCFKRGVIPVNVNYRYVAGELRYLFDDAQPAALVLERSFAPRVAEAGGPSHLIVVGDGSEEDCRGVGYEEALAAASPERDASGRSGDDRYIVYTGGTTGMPKGVVWRHEDVYFALGGGIDPFTGEKVSSPGEAAEKARGNEGPMTMLPLGPLMHLSGQWGTLSRLLQGNTIVLYTGRTLDPGAVWRLVERERVNVLLISGDAMARPLADALERADHDLSSLFSVASGAAVLSGVVRRRLLELLPNVVLSDSVGSSEGGFNGMQMVQREGGDGIRINPSPETAVLVGDRPARPGETGKLARSGHIPLGYWGDEEKTRETFLEVEGRRWVVPGDWARLEEDGTILLLGRGSTCINTGGEKVYPEEVEAVVKGHPEVYDCLVVGLPDERWGERVVAVVQPRPGSAPSLEALRDHCRGSLAGYKLPREVRLVEELPRHPTGKPDYPRAREMVGA